MSETSIPLDKKTRDRLAKFGTKGETWIKLVNRLLDEKSALEIEISLLNECLDKYMGNGN